MASAIIGALRVNLGIDTAAFSTELQQAQSKLAGFGALAKRAILPVVAAATSAAAGMAAAVRSTINAADETSKAAAKFGIPIEELSRLKYAADLSDVSLQGLGTSVGRLSRNMRDAQQGVASAVEPFETLGVAFENADGSLRSSSDVLADLADRFSAMPDGAEKTALAMELMGRSGAEMIPLLNGGSQALQDMMAEADKFGQVFSAETGAAAEQFNDNLTRLRGAFGALSADLTAKLAPHLAQFTDWMVRNSPAIGQFVADVVGLAAALGKAAVAIGSFVSKAGAEFRALVAAMEAAVAALPERFRQIGRDIMAGLWDGLKSSASGIVSWIGDFATGLWTKAKQAVGAQSPAKKFLELGANILQGLLLGLQSYQGPVLANMRSFASTLGDALDGVGDDYADALPDAKRFTGELERQAGLGQAIGDSFTALGKGILQISTATGGIRDALGGVMSSITDTLQGPFIEEMNKVFKSLGDKLASATQNIGGGAGRGLLDPVTISGIGSGLGMAAAGALQGSSQAIGAGIGQAAGAAIGSFLGPIGTVLGGIGGSLLGGLFGGGDDAPTVTAAGTVFAGTPFARDVSGRSYSDEEGKTGALALVQAGLNDLLRNFNDVVTDIGKKLVAVPDAFRPDLRPVRDNLGGEGSEDFDFGDVAAVQKLIAGTLSDTIYSNGGATEKLAQEIEQRVAKVMEMVVQVATAGLPSLTEAQKAYREIGEQFNAENQEILHALGFTKEQILKARREAEGALRTDFAQELVQGIVDTGRASKAELAKWRELELEELQERRAQAIRTAQEIGASVRLVQSAFKAERKEVEAEFGELMEKFAAKVRETASNMERLSFVGNALNELVQGGNTARLGQWLRVSRSILELQRKEAVEEARRLGVDVSAINALFHRKAIDLEKQFNEMRLSKAKAAEEQRLDALLDAWTKRQGALADRLNTLESKRSDVLQELTRRVDEARQSEQSLLDARRGLATGALNPGGPTDRFRALQAQFAAAIKQARGGNEAAAGRAAGLASELLEAGRGVFASGTRYADLFRSVNSELLAAQRGFDARADKIAAVLDAKTFAETSERSTKALIAILGRVDASVEKVETAVKDLAKTMGLAQQRQSVARGAA